MCWNLRWALVQAREFGDPDLKSLTELMANAFEQFKIWRRQKRVACSQKRFTEGMLFKQKHGYYLQCKAFNGRVVLQWLAECCKARVDAGTATPVLTLNALALCLRSSILASFTSR